MGFDVFTKHTYVLRFLGILLPGEISNRFVRLIINAWFYYLSICFPILILCFLFGVTNMHNMYSVTASMYSISGVLSSASATIKLYLLHHHRRDIKQLFEMLRPYKANTTVGIFTTVLIYIYEFLALGFRVISLVEVFAKRKLVILMPFWTPFPRDNAAVALATYFFYQGSAIIKTICNFFTDAVFLNIANQICHRMFILKNTYKLIGLTSLEKKELLNKKNYMNIPKGSQVTDDALLKLCVKEHILILKIVEKFSLIQNRLFLPQCFNAFTSICVALFLVSQSDNMVREAFKVTPWTTLIFLQLFVSCFAGELIKQKCHDFYTSSYCNGWYNCSPEVKSSLLVVQAYTSRPTVMKGAYVFELCLHTYEVAVREVFSTFTVLYQLFNTK